MVIWGKVVLSKSKLEEDFIQLYTIVLLNNNIAGKHYDF